MKIAKTFKCPRYLDSGIDRTPVDIQLNKYLKSNQHLDICTTQYDLIDNEVNEEEEVLFVVFKDLSVSNYRPEHNNNYSYKENRGNQYDNRNVSAWKPPRNNYRY